MRFSRCADLNGRKVVSSFYSSLSLFGRFLPVRGSRRRVFFSLLQVDQQSAGPSGTDAAYSSAAGHKKTQAFPIAHPDLSNFRMKSGRSSRGNACVLLTDVAKRQTSAVFARIAQQDPADGHHAEEEIVVQMRNDLQGTERGQA